MKVKKAVSGGGPALINMLCVQYTCYGHHTTEDVIRITSCTCMKLCLKEFAVLRTLGFHNRGVRCSIAMSVPCSHLPVGVDPVRCHTERP